MPSKSVKRMIEQASQYHHNHQFGFCDAVVGLFLIGLVVFILNGVYNHASLEATKIQQQSILCIKDFDSSGCNPFNMTPACQEKLQCIKNGDGLGPSEILQIANSHVKENGAIPVFIVFLVVLNQIRRRKDG